MRPDSAIKISSGVRERLLSEARRLFAAAGYDGVTVDAIVNAAGVNKRMVYHYFGNKEGLYGAVLTRVFEELQMFEEKFFAPCGNGQKPDEAIAAIVETYFSFLMSHPEFVRLLLWENLQEGRHLALVGKTVSKSPILGYLDSILLEGAKSGEFRADLDARLVLISLIGLCLVYFSNRHTLSLTVGLNLSSPKVLREAGKHTVSLLLEGIRRS